MRVVVTGATGNVGTAVVEALARHPQVEQVVGVARRLPTGWSPPKTSFHALDITEDPLDEAFHHADAVIHLAWAIQPSRDPSALWRSNVVGSERVLRAASIASVPAVLHASSVGAYSPGPRTSRVDESWATNGVPTLPYSSQKAYVERLLDRFAMEHPSTRVVRMRPALIFRRAAASGIRRLFLGFVPTALVPAHAATWLAERSPIAFQAVHTEDVAEAFVTATTGDASGAFNLAAEPILGQDRRRDLVAGLARPLAHVGWSAHLQPVDPAWIDLARRVPMLDASRARRELGWEPRHSAVDAVRELFEGFEAGSGVETEPLAPSAPTSLVP